MKFYLTLQSNIQLKETPPIDCIYLKINGKEVSCDWDEQDGCMEDNYLYYRMKGVSFDSEYANGILDDCPDIEINPDILFEEHDMWDKMDNYEDFKFEIIHFAIADDGKIITIVQLEEN